MSSGLYMAIAGRNHAAEMMRCVGCKTRVCVPVHPRTGGTLPQSSFPGDEIPKHTRGLSTWMPVCSAECRATYDAKIARNVERLFAEGDR